MSTSVTCIYCGSRDFRLSPRGYPCCTRCGLYGPKTESNGSAAASVDASKIPTPIAPPPPREESPASAPGGDGDDEPRVVIMEWKSANSYPEPQNNVQVALGTLSEGLSTRFETDAHFQALTSNVARRLNNDAIGKVPISVVYYVGDVDDPVAHLLEVPARASWREVELEKITRLRRRHPRVILYDTRGGYRIIFSCAEPFAIASAADKEAWWARYLAFRRYLFEVSSIGIDPTCKDFGRLYRLPHVRRDGQDSRSGLLGDPIDIEALGAAAFSS